MSKKYSSKHTHRKDKTKNQVPLPKYMGRILPSKHGGYTWECSFYIGKDYLSSMCHPISKPNFLSEQGAGADMKEKIGETLKIMCKAYEPKEQEKIMKMVSEL
jgi:hypothetical protein